MSALDTLRAEIAETTEQIRALTENEDGTARDLSDEDAAALEALNADLAAKTASAKRISDVQRSVNAANEALNVDTSGGLTVEKPRERSEVARTLSYGEFVSKQARGELDKSEAAEVERAMSFRALADATTGNVPGILPDAWLRDIVDFIGVSRPFITAFDQRPLPDSGMTINYPQVTTRPLVAEQATEKTEVASQATVIAQQSTGVKTYGGGEDISLQTLERTDPGYLGILMELYAEEMAVLTDQAAITVALAAIGAQNELTLSAAANGGDINATLATAAKLVFTARLGAADSFVMGLDVWEYLASAEDADGRPLFPHMSATNPVGMSNVGSPDGEARGVRWVVDPNMTSTKAVFGQSRAFTSFLGPVRTLASDVPALIGRDQAVFQFGAFACRRPDALVEITLGA